jgi:hypothetical protein
MILSLEIKINIDVTKDIRIRENCLNSDFGMYEILKMRIILEINVTVDINSVEIQSSIRLIGKLNEFKVKMENSRDRNMALLSRKILIIRVIREIINNNKERKIEKIMVPQTIVLLN